MDGERSPKHPEKHHNFRGHEIIHFGGIKKHCNCKVILGDFPYNSALFGRGGGFIFFYF